ncbi:MAG: hypothetical protein AAF943_00840 [Pseudomonadota bacterium]
MRQAERDGNLRAALTWAGKAVAFSDTARLWTTYARLALDAAQGGDRAQRRQRRTDALRAGLNGYLRSHTSAAQAEALRVLAKALEENSRGRDMIPALRLVQTLAPSEGNAAALDTAIARHGFRILAYQIDSDAAAPRICARFSEDLVPAGVDYEPFCGVRSAAWSRR